jgi:hypothetical protein
MSAKQQSAVEKEWSRNTGLRRYGDTCIILLSSLARDGLYSKPLAPFGKETTVVKKG